MNKPSTRAMRWWRDSLSWILIVGVLVVVAAAALYVVSPQLRPHTTIHLGDGIFSTDIVTRDAHATGALNDTRSLRQDQALLAVYDHDDMWPVAVPDGRDPLDIVWLDKDKKVVHIVKNIDTNVDATTYVPKVAARYVVELPVGTVDGRLISIGGTATFNENDTQEAR